MRIKIRNKNFHEDKDFHELLPEELSEIDKRINMNMMPDLTLEGCVNARISFGGTAPCEVERQINVSKSWIESI